MLSRRRAVRFAVAVAVLLALAPAYGAFPGPNGRIFFDAGGTGGPGRQIVSIASEGGDRRPVADGVEAAVSADGRQIAFVRGGDLYLAAPTGTDEIALTNTAVVERTPSFSPNGDKLVFATELSEAEEDPGHIFTIGVDGSGLTRLTQGEQPDFTPSYSPSGNRIVFVHRLPDGGQVFTMDADGSNREQLTSSDSSSLAPTWSPDGDRIAFEREADRASSIFSIRPDGSDLDRLTKTPNGGDHEPSYAPRGNKIVYRGSTDDGKGPRLVSLFVVSAAGGPSERLTPGLPAGVDADPYWSSAP